MLKFKNSIVAIVSIVTISSVLLTAPKQVQASEVNNSITASSSARAYTTLPIPSNNIQFNSIAKDISGNLLINVTYDRFYSGTIIVNPNSSSSWVSYANYSYNNKLSVQAVQVCLNKLGYGLAVDGSFGPASDAAIRTFQFKNNTITGGVDGSVGPKTWEAIYRNLV